MTYTEILTQIAAQAFAAELSFNLEGWRKGEAVLLTPNELVDEVMGKSEALADAIWEIEKNRNNT